MRVGIDIVGIGSGIREGAGGAPGYYHGIVPELARDPRVEELVVYIPRWYARAAEWTGLKAVRVVRCRVSQRRPFRVAYEQFAMPSFARAHRLDVLFSTANVRPLLYRGCNVVGLHAIQHFLLADDVGRFRSAYVKFTVPRSLRTADLTVAVTDTLRADAIRLFDLDPARIVAVPMGPTPWVTAQLDGEARSNQRYELPGGEPYVLCISRLYVLKNHRRLIRAYAKLVHDHDIPHRLVIAGADAEVTREELATIAAQAGVAEQVVLLGQVPQSQVVPLYAGATAVAYVSLYETFGHPVLEAFAMDTPLLTSHRGATAEVAGGAARLVDPESEDDIAEGLREVLLDEDLRARLIAAGRARVRQFSWKKCATGTVDAFARALEARSGPIT